jgi:hypothetical protein
VNKLSLPPGVSREDAEQEAAALALRWYAEGRRGATLHVRVWGDLKDLYGRQWKAHYNGAGRGEPLPTHIFAPNRSDPHVALDVREAVAKLTPVRRRVVEECALKGRSQADVAAETGVTVQTIKMTLVRARRDLAVLLASYAEGE